VDAPLDFKFWLAHRPGDWIVDTEGRILPDLRRIADAPGVHSTGRHGDFRATKARHEAGFGFKFIPHDVLGPGTSYLRVFINKKGKPVHRTIFDRPIARQSGRTKFRCDREAWRDFLFFLQTDPHLPGHIDPPRPEIVEGLLVQTRRHRRALRAPSTDDPAKRAEYADLCKTVESQIGSLERAMAAAVEHYGALGVEETVEPSEALAGLAKFRRRREASEGAAPVVVEPVTVEPAPPAVDLAPPKPKPKTKPKRKSRAKPKRKAPASPV
jgi:hypothetical protein